MSEITEIIPDDLPDWAIKAMAEGQLFNVTFARIRALEAEEISLLTEISKLTTRQGLYIGSTNVRIKELETKNRGLEEAVLDCGCNYEWARREGYTSDIGSSGISL